MAVDQNKRQELTNFILECIREVFPVLIDRIKQKKYILSYSNFPTLSFAENGFPRLNSNSFGNNGPKDFTSLFRGYGGNPEIDWNNFSTLIGLYNFIREDEELLSYFGLSLKIEVPNIDLNKSNVQFLIEDILDKYIHTYGYDFDLANFLEIIGLRINFAFLEELPITIYVPILFLNFDVEKYHLIDGISIEKLSDQLHLCRAEAKSHNVLVHDCVLAGATHALVIKNYFVKNESKEAYECLYYKDAYPNTIIQNFFSALRLVNKDKTGYAQIFSESENWTSGFKEKLPNIHGCSVREFPNEFELDRYWLYQSFPTVDLEQLDKIKYFYEKLANNNHKSIPIALKRLNSCLLRHDEEDTVLDATIALEVLLSDDGKTEMTHKLALRIAALSKLDKECKEIPKEIFSKVKKIYSYRSGIVHGTKDLTKTRTIKIPESIELKTVDVAINILKMVVRVLLCNEKYLEAKIIDEELLLGVDPN
ncbi:HEPN domain-containing protein [Acinetobacter tianfuensis]|uniref:Uncharacterized protein n=1 Tax=Acinetobacter tianfuensis TaxID=2419603 RepID=A0A3A8EAM3_9GAMM|nr:HEPN domain-containing protein [Acinetobacter tianfuensis]RKG30566.1 hypothetical protein D7V32_11090 [Acinetobacter tianfuensis]